MSETGDGVEDADGNDATVSSAEITNSTAVMMQTVEGNASQSATFLWVLWARMTKLKLFRLTVWMQHQRMFPTAAMWFPVV